MREIKFRAWDKKNKEMIQVDRLACDNFGLVIDIWYEPVCDWAGLEGFELMQYTGLKDKNGKEIYEGDMLDYARGSSIKYEVIEDDRDDFPRGWTIKATHPQYGHPEVEALVVVGNIYENPELLEKT